MPAEYMLKTDIVQVTRNKCNLFFRDELSDFMEKQGADAPGVLTLTTSLSTVRALASSGIYF
jgi:hypothetical protein